MKNDLEMGLDSINLVLVIVIMQLYNAHIRYFFKHVARTSVGEAEFRALVEWRVPWDSLVTTATAAGATIVLSISQIRFTKINFWSSQKWIIHNLEEFVLLASLARAPTSAYSADDDEESYRVRY